MDIEFFEFLSDNCDCTMIPCDYTCLSCELMIICEEETANQIRAIFQ